VTAIAVMLGVAPAALPAWDRLCAALDAFDRPPICRANPDDWADARATVRAEAAAACSWCPVVEACREYGRHESAGVWGAVDRTPPAHRQETAA